MQVDDCEPWSMYVERIYPMPMVCLNWKEKRGIFAYHYSRLIDEHYVHRVVAAA